MYEWSHRWGCSGQACAFDFYAPIFDTPIQERCVKKSIDSHSERSAKDEQSEYSVFTNALRKVLSVPRSELTKKLDAEKRARKLRRNKPSFRASHAEG